MKIFVIPVVLVVFAAAASAAEITVGKFGCGELSGWKEEPFKGRPKTSYQLVKENGATVLKAQSRHAASGLVKRIELDPKKEQVLRWSWKVEHTLKGEDVSKKSGDDFAARVYVVFPRTFLWRTRAINYVWASKMPKGSSAPSPYTRNAQIIAVESGDENVGKWVNEERNVYQDYKRLFGEEPPKIGAVAIMSDTDDTGDEVTAWFGDITVNER